MRNIVNSFWRQLLGGRLQQPEKFMAKLKAQRSILTTPPEETSRFLYDPTDAVAFQAPERLAVPVDFFTTAGALRQHNRADWQHTDYRIQVFASKLIEEFRQRNIPLYVHSAFRTEAEQRDLYNKGRSKAVWPRAPHCQGKAVDIVHAAYHWNLTPDEWALIGKVGANLAQRLGLYLTWGGNWGFYDPAHWEISDWRSDITTPEAGEPVRYTPRGLLRATQGQR